MLKTIKTCYCELLNILLYLFIPGSLYILLWSHIPLIIADYDPCVNIVCGPNAQCVSDRIQLSNSSSQMLPLESEGDSSRDGSSPSLPQLTHDVSPHGHCKCQAGFEGNPTNLETGCIPGKTGFLLLKLPECYIKFKK